MHSIMRELQYFMMLTYPTICTLHSKTEEGYRWFKNGSFFPPSVQQLLYQTFNDVFGQDAQLAVMQRVILGKINEWIW